MQTNSSTKQLQRPARPGSLGVLSALLLTALMWTTGSKAQLSGTYTVCPSGCNYSTISAAASDLSSKGISASVTFNVAAGTFTEAVTINPYSGGSTTKTVTFQGAGRGKTKIENSSTVLMFNSCSYVTFAGFSITNTSTGYATFANYGQNDGVINCDITGSPSASYLMIDQYTLNYSVINNHVVGGNYTVYIYSSPGTTVYSNATYKNNRFVKFGYMAFYINYGNNNQYIGNYIDSSANGYGYGIYSLYESGANYDKNISIAPGMYYPALFQYSNYYASGTEFRVTNNMFANYQYYLYFYNYYTSNMIIAHNTAYGNTSNWGLYMYNYYASTGIKFVSNIIYGGGSSTAYVYVTGTTFPAPFTMIDGNDFINPNGGSPVLMGTTAYATIGAYQSAMSAYTYTSPYDGKKRAFEGFASSMLPTFINTTKDLHLNQTKVAPTGVYAGIDVDIDGDARCKLFPTAGADESTFGKSKPLVKIGVPSKVYPGTPTYVYQSAKAGEPKAHQWYLNGVKVSDSVVLFTNKFVTGSNCLKLVTQTCGGNDSDTQCFTVAAPTAVPGTDFIANKNSIKAGEYVMFKDLSSNGPTKWQWTITPDSVVVSGVKVPSIKYIFGSATYQNPWVQFNYGGKYKVCLTATNGVGKGSTICKTDYINVIPTVNMGSAAVVKDASGYLYDNGGPNNNYTAIASPYKTGILIDPCADSVYLTFTMFDTYCGYDYVRLYEGRDDGGKPLWRGTCSAGTGFAGNGPGYVGGKAYACTYTCMPDVTKPDTFKAKKTMYVQAVTYIASNSAGFAAFWWSKPTSSTKPKASFTSSNAGDSVCTNAQLNFINTTKIDPNDPATFLWDLDGDISTFECIGACKTAGYPYFLAGPVKVTLIAVNCGGSDTATRTLTVYNPSKPKAAFSADNTTPTTNDIVFFTSQTAQCVDNYKWTITPVAPATGKAVYMNGTSDLSQNPQVNFTGKGLYDVTMFIDNTSGSDQLVKTKYINVRDAYCIPSVSQINAGLGISKVVFNTISNKTTQASTDYSNFAVNPSLSTTIAIGATYPLTVSRDASLLFESINRTAYIDWNQDGSFVGSGEIFSIDSNTYAVDATVKIKVPTSAKLGATVMRIAVNRGSYSNKPCGQNEFGEYHDYRLYVTPYNILPVITLKGKSGKDTISLEQGNSFVEDGYTASSFLYGDITKDVKVNNKVNSIVPGVYLVTYDVADSVGNKAVQKYRIVRITPDKTAPDLKVALPETTYVAVTKTPMHPVPVPKVISADDLVDGPLAGSVIIDSAKVQTNIVGTYVVTYNVTDLSNNTATVTRVIIVIDTFKPVLKLVGNDPVTVQVYNSYVEQGVTATDNYYTAGQLNPNVLITSTVDTSKLGTYKVTYTLTDPSGNVADAVTRTVIVVDTIPPVLALNGNQLDSVSVFHAYNDPGVTYSDNYDKNADINLTISGTFYAKFPGGKNPNITGSYTIIYTATDKSGNKTTVTRTVKVQDREAPIITLKGDAAVSVCRWFNYVDDGYNVSDNYNKVSELVITEEGTFGSHGGTTMYGLLTLRYKAVDKAGNVGYSDYRYIQVKPETDFTCQSGVKENLGLDKYITVFPNPNNGIFTISSNLPTQEKVRISVTNMLGQEIAVVHNGMISQNSFTVDLSNQSSGVYLLNIVSNNQTLTKRIELTR